MQLTGKTPNYKALSRLLLVGSQRLSFQVITAFSRGVSTTARSSSAIYDVLILNSSASLFVNLLPTYLSCKLLTELHG